MGQAKQRGTFEDRKAQALARQQAEREAFAQRVADYKAAQAARGEADTTVKTFRHDGVATRVAVMVGGLRTGSVGLSGETLLRVAAMENLPKDKP